MELGFNLLWSNVQQWNQELWVSLFCRKEISQLEEGDVGTLHPIFQFTCHQWITYMEKLGKLKLILSYLMV